MVGCISDITERKKAEEAIRESDEKYRTLFDNMLEGFAYCRMIYDSNGHPEDLIYLNGNKAFDRIIGIKNVTGKLFTKVFPGVRQTYPELFEIYGRVALTGTPESFEIDFKPIEKWLHISVYSPEKEHFVAVFEDITERKRSEAALHLSNAILSSQMEVTTEGILVVDEAGKIISYNHRFTEIWGIPPDVIASRSDERVLQSVLDKLVNPKEFLTRVRYLYMNREEKCREEVRLIDTRTLDRYSAPMIGSDGRYYGRVWYFQDITDRKKAEQEITRIANEWEITFNATSDGICLIDANQNLQRCNDRMREILGGVMHEDLVDQPCWEVVHKATGPIPECPFISAKKTLTRTRIEIPAGDHWFEVTADPIIDPSGTFAGAVHIMRDITDRKRAEDALRHANKQLNLLSSITRHDILNQLMVLKGYLELSKDVIDKPASLIVYIRNVEAAANAIEHQITFTKNYQELGAAAPAWQNINATIAKALTQLPMRDIVVKTDPEAPEIFADPLFEKVFYNLIDNALRYGGTRMKTIRISYQES
ncbi:MAG: PAS domain S-box protein, partial [Methanoregula sp.]|nr:PAS domain S-box protein [Methanoregula sp.]